MELPLNQYMFSVVSVLGPLLFIFYVNTLTNLKLSGGSKLVMYADDLVLHKAIITEEEWIPFQNDINSIVQWVDENLLTLNTSKCNCMLLTRKVNTMPHLFLNNDLIEEVRSYKYLGVTVSTDLKWDMHITRFVREARNYLGLYIYIEDFITVLMQYS